MLQAEGRFTPDDSTWLSNLASNAMAARDLWLAGEYAHLLAALRWGTTWYPRGNAPARHSLPLLPADVFLTVSKLQHDIEQLLYLQEKGILGAELTDVIEAYRATAERLSTKGIAGQVPLDDEARKSIGHVFNRIVHVRDTPRIERVFSDSGAPRRWSIST